MVAAYIKWKVLKRLNGKIHTPWEAPSDEILIAKLGKEEIIFIPRHSRGHEINPSEYKF